MTVTFAYASAWPFLHSQYQAAIHPLVLRTLVTHAIIVRTRMKRGESVSVATASTVTCLPDHGGDVFLSWYTKGPWTSVDEQQRDTFNPERLQ
jgi:hypothetical protein